MRRIDLLSDTHYLAVNAAITAEAALGLILSNLPQALTETNILILGWGRIGKCLSRQLKALGTTPTIYARNPNDRAMLLALGYHTLTPDQFSIHLPIYQCIINTIPAAILEEYDAQKISDTCFKMDLASVLSIPGKNVLHARGLPGKMKPETSGKLIADTILSHLRGGE
jgi:dipicolinate synthase subunit A